MPADKDTDWIRDGNDFLAEWVAEPLNHAVRTRVVYTEGLTPEQAAARIDVLGSAPSHAG